MHSSEVKLTNTIEVPLSAGIEDESSLRYQELDHSIYGSLIF